MSKSNGGGLKSVAAPELKSVSAPESLADTKGGGLSSESLAADKKDSWVSASGGLTQLCLCCVLSPKRGNKNVLSASDSIVLSLRSKPWIPFCISDNEVVILQRMTRIENFGSMN